MKVTIVGIFDVIINTIILKKFIIKILMMMLDQSVNSSVSNFYGELEFYLESNFEI